MKTISILGSTGSIGAQSLDIIRQHPHKFKVAALSTNSNIELLKKQIEEFKPLAVAVGNEKQAELLKTDITIYKGLEGIRKIAAIDEADTVINSLVGSIGVLPTMDSIRAGKNIALANKETLVTAGDIVMREAKKQNSTIMPIDSEHSAIFQCLNGEDKKTIRKIMITCSGGAFKNKSAEELMTVKAKDALKHPTWNMGNKITIDCATLMNKGFEVIEAHQLYNVPYEQIEVVIHPQSIIHSMVEFSDKSVMAQLGNADMRIPIQYALSYPKRLPNNLEGLDIKKIAALNFKEANTELFPCLKYAYEAGKSKGIKPAVLNAANEIVVAAYLKDKIKFNDIPIIIREALDSYPQINNPVLDEIMDIDKKVKEDTLKKIEDSN